MLKIITRKNKEKYSEYLNEMWRQRYDVFVKKLGWNVSHKDGMEIDAFDSDDAVYILALDDDGQIKGSVRLLPSTGPHILGDVFPHLCARGVPCGENIWEASRFYSLTARHRLLERDYTVKELYRGVIEYGLIHNIAQITCVAGMVAFPALIQAGWEIDPIGLPQNNGDEIVLAFSIKVTQKSLQALKGNSRQANQAPLPEREREKVYAPAG